MTNVVAKVVTDYVSYYKAIFARALFGSHALVAVWRTTVLMGPAYWGLAFGVMLLTVEYIVTMWVRVGEEWKWISPSTLCYLASTASSLWVQKLQSLGHVTSLNGSNIATLPSTNMKLDFSAPDWLLLTEQTMMVTIILSRWLLPKGELAHKELSALLLLYLGLSADILDFSTIFSEPKVAADEVFCYMILIIWTGSLCQFALVLTSTSKSEKNESSVWRSIICSSELWQILVQVFLQDFPFLLVRVVALLNYQVFNFTIIFFVCKNTLVILLEIYHLIAVCKHQKARFKRRQHKIKGIKAKMTAVKDVITAANKTKALVNGSKLGKNSKFKKTPTTTGIEELNGDASKDGEGKTGSGKRTDANVVNNNTIDIFGISDLGKLSSLKKAREKSGVDEVEDGQDKQSDDGINDPDDGVIVVSAASNNKNHLASNSALLLSAAKLSGASDPKQDAASSRKNHVAPNSAPSVSAAKLSVASDPKQDAASSSKNHVAQISAPSVSAAKLSGASDSIQDTASSSKHVAPNTDLLVSAGTSDSIQKKSQYLSMNGKSRQAVTSQEPRREKSSRHPGTGRRLAYLNNVLLKGTATPLEKPARSGTPPLGHIQSSFSTYNTSSVLTRSDSKPGRWLLD